MAKFVSNSFDQLNGCRMLLRISQYRIKQNVNLTIDLFCYDC